MPHIRYYIPLPDSQSSPIIDGIKPLVFVDKVTARIRVAGPVRIKGREYKANFIPNYRWINLRDGKVGVWACGLGNEVFVTFNPSTIVNGYNLFPYRDDVLASLRMVLPSLLEVFPQFPLMRPEWNLIRAGYSELSEIHLTADFEFPSWSKLIACMRELKARWSWRWNRRSNDNFSTGFYLNHDNWDLLVYIKDEEIVANHSDWPNAVKSRSRNRLRIEVKLRRQELLKLGKRLKRRHPDLPDLELHQIGDWEPHVYPLAFDLYAGRIQPRGQKLIEGNGGQVPLFGLVAHHSGLPVYPREQQAHASYYEAPCPRWMLASHNLIVRTEQDSIIQRAQKG
jgi:hypothetical protein